MVNETKFFNNNNMMTMYRAQEEHNRHKPKENNIRSSMTTTLKSIVFSFVCIFILNSAAYSEEVFQLPSSSPISDGSQYGVVSIDQGIIMRTRPQSGNDQLIKLNSDWNLDSAFGENGYLDLPFLGLKFKKCGDKIWGTGFNPNSSRYEVYRLHPENPGNFELIATNHALTSTGNGVDHLFYIDGYLYVVLIDNSSSSTGTGIMLFNTETETIEIDIQTYDGEQIRGVFQDELDQVWIHKSESNSLIRIDSALQPIAGTDIAFPSYVGIYGKNHDGSLIYAWRAEVNTLKAYVGSAGGFLNDLSDNGLLDGSDIITIDIPDAPGGSPSIYGIAAVSERLALYYHIGPTSASPNYLHYVVLYDLESGQHDSNFNGGEPLALDSAVYNEYFHRAYTHLFSVNNNIYFAKKDNSSTLRLDELFQVLSPEPISQQASSVTAPWHANNVVDVTEDTYWMSEVNTGHDEWVQIQYDRPFVAKSVSIVLANGRQGTNPVLQASDNAIDWIDLATFNAYDYPNDERNFRHIDFNLENQDAYQYYRYHSDPTVYVLIEYLAFSESAVINEITGLINGETVDNLENIQGEWLFFKLSIPKNATNYTIRMSGGSGDADLYTRMHDKPNLAAYDCRPYWSGNNETCSQDDPPAGDLYIGIYAYVDYSDVALSVTYIEKNSHEIIDLGNGETVDNLENIQGEWLFFKLSIPENATNYTISMSGGSGDADLYTRMHKPSETAYDCRPYMDGNNETCSQDDPPAGDLYIGIHAYADYSGLTLSVTYTE